jgi:hypothetical protein
MDPQQSLRDCGLPDSDGAAAEHGHQSPEAACGSRTRYAADFRGGASTNQAEPGEEFNRSCRELTSTSPKLKGSALMPRRGHTNTERRPRLRHTESKARKALDERAIMPRLRVKHPRSFTAVGRRRARGPDDISRQLLRP